MASLHAGACRSAGEQIESFGGELLDAVFAEEREAERAASAMVAAG